MAILAAADAGSICWPATDTQGLEAAGLRFCPVLRPISSALTSLPRAVSLDDETFAAQAVEQAGVAVVPLSPAPSRTLPAMIRLCFAKRDETIDARGSDGQSTEFDVMILRTSARAACQARVTSGGSLASHSPIDGKPIGTVDEATPDLSRPLVSVHKCILWRTIPAPQRGRFGRSATNCAPPGTAPAGDAWEKIVPGPRRVQR
jgi:hypothetical protein